MDQDIDLINRDPHSMNHYVQVEFDDVLGEPTGAHSSDCVWKNSFKCFTCGKNFCYKFLTFFCGILNLTAKKLPRSSLSYIFLNLIIRYLVSIVLGLCFWRDSILCYMVLDTLLESIKYNSSSNKKNYSHRVRK